MAEIADQDVDEDVDVNDKQMNERIPHFLAIVFLFLPFPPFSLPDDG